MNKIVKRRLIGTIICFALGIACGVFVFVNNGKMREDLLDYLSGFSSGLTGAGLYFLICTIRALRNPKIAKNMEVIEQDERLHSINNKALASTFKISMIVEALLSIGAAVLNYMQAAECLGLVIGIQLILYVVVYLIIERKS